MKFGFIAVSADEKTSIGGLGSTSEMEINMYCIEMLEFDVSSSVLSSTLDSSQAWSPPPPQAFRHRNIDTDAMDNEQVFLQRQQASRHIKNYKTAVGREIVMEEPGKWMCASGQDGLRECAAKIADFICQPSLVE